MNVANLMNVANVANRNDCAKIKNPGRRMHVNPGCIKFIFKYVAIVSRCCHHDIGHIYHIYHIGHINF